MNKRYAAGIFGFIFILMLTILFLPMIATSFFQSASSAEDCTLVDTPGCPCSSGGSDIAINERYELLWNAHLTMWSPLGTICTHNYRCHPETTLENGKCETDGPVGVHPETLERMNKTE